MEVLHETEEPDTGVSGGLFEPGPSGSGTAVVHTVTEKTVVGQLTFFGGEPLGGQWGRRQKWVSEDSNETSGSSLNDEEPLPPGVPLDAVELEDAGGD